MGLQLSPLGGWALRQPARGEQSEESPRALMTRALNPHFVHENDVAEISVTAGPEVEAIGFGGGPDESPGDTTCHQRPATSPGSEVDRRQRERERLRRSLCFFPTRPVECADVYPLLLAFLNHEADLPAHDITVPPQLLRGLGCADDSIVVPMRMLRQVIVFDAADLAAESAFWAGILHGQVLAEDDWHSVLDASGEWRIGVQLAPNHVPPDWPDGTIAQQVHLDLHAENFSAANDEAIALGARLLRPATDRDAKQGHQVYADPAGHPFCIGWGQPSRERLAKFVSDHFGQNEPD